MMTRQQAAQKGVFLYNDGFRDVYGDPAEIQGRLVLAGPGRDLDKFDEDFRLISAKPKSMVQAEGPDGDQAEGPDEASIYAALARVAETARHALQLKPLDDATGDGLTVRQAIGVLNDFFLFMEDQSTGDAEEGGLDEATPASDVAAKGEVPEARPMAAVAAV